MAASAGQGSLALPGLARQVGGCVGVTGGRSSLLYPRSSVMVTATCTVGQNMTLPSTILPFYAGEGPYLRLRR